MHFGLLQALACLAMPLLLIGSSMRAASPPEVAGATNYSRLPVVLVHGSGLDSTYWNKLIAALIADGYPRAYVRALDMRPSDGSNIDAANLYIRPAAEDLLEIANRESRREGVATPRKVILIAHSMGAVSSRWYARQLSPDAVAGLIGIAPANHGSNALCGFSGEGDRELCPAFAQSALESRIQIALNGLPESTVDETAYGVGADSAPRARVAPDGTRRLSFWTLRIDPDEWIVPARSAILDGAGGLELHLPSDLPVRLTSPGNYLLEAPVRHDDLPANGHVVRWTIEVVRAINGHAAGHAS